ncbi:MAG: ATP-binding protein [Desulfobacterales bacterium]|nr:ATP-binding protein [Desulfobacterales bacterium]
MKVLLSLHLPARLENLGRFKEFVADCARTEGFDQRRIQEIELALEEALVNIFNYAYPETPGDIEINCKLETGRLIIEIIDSGIPFDMTSLSDPDLTADVEERKIGGLGIFLVKKMVDEVRYRREKDRNILTFAVKKEKE